MAKLKFQLDLVPFYLCVFSSELEGLNETPIWIRNMDMERLEDLDCWNLSELNANDN